MKQLVNMLLNRFCVESVSFANIDAGGLVYLENKSAHIVLNANLSKPKALFALIHEVGHLALDILPDTPCNNVSPSDELLVHQWAIQQLDKILTLEDAKRLYNSFLVSDKHGYQMVEKLFTKNKINFDIFEEFKMKHLQPNCLYNNSELYDAYHMQFTHDLKFYSEILSDKSNCLELGSGTGRLTIPLKKSGINIEGLDISLDMLRAAQAHAKNTEIDLAVHHADARNFDLSKKFDAIIFPANGFLHLQTYDDLSMFFSSIKNNLDDDGLLVLDIFNPDFRFLNVAEKEAFEIAQIIYRGEKLKIFEKSIFDRASQVNRISWYYKNFEGQTVFQNEFSQRIYFHQEMLLIIKNFGFKIVNILGDFQGNKYSSSSRNQIFFLEKI